MLYEGKLWLMKKSLLIDGNSILNRAFYGIRPLTSKSGLYTHAVYGMINIILKNMEKIKPDYAAVAFDLPTPTFRHKMYDGYKAQRKGMPPELAVQLPYAKKAVEGLGIKICELAGYEADDILGTLAEYSTEDPELCTYILTGDRDSLQLIRDNIHVLLATTGETVDTDRARFFEKYGVQPEQFADVKALMGDSSDNIPGVSGVGEKTALKLIAEYGSIDEVYAELERSPEGNAVIKGALLKKLSSGRADAEMSLELARICKSVPLGGSIEDISYGGFDRPALKALLYELELFALIKRLGLNEHTDGEAEAPGAAHGDGSADDSADAEGAGKLEGVRDAAAHPEGENTAKKREPDGAATLPYPAEDIIPVCFDRERILSLEGGELVCEELSRETLGRLFGDPSHHIALLDSKEAHARLLDAEVSAEADIFDISLAAYVLDPTASGYPLERLAVAYLGDGDVSEYDDKKRLEVTAALVPELYLRLCENGELKLYSDIELPLAEVLASMERDGFKVDVDGLRSYGEVLAARAREYASAIYDLAGEEFNIQSPKQLSEILFGKLGLPAKKKTKTGYSTDAETLEKLRYGYPIVDLILEYRQLSKLMATYVDGLIKVADKNGKVHTSFKQTVTATGRLSSVEPNLQNIPIRTPMGRELRRFFCAEGEDRVLVDADYSQIELRLLAAVSEDKGMIEAFRGGEDIHTRTAAQMLGITEADVTPEQRKSAKAVNFGIMYGIGEFSLARDLHVSRAEAGEYINSYFASFPAVKSYLDRTIEEAHRDGYVSTLFGRRRAIPELASPKKAMQAFGERVARNSPIQGAAADIIKLAMIGVYRRLRESGTDARLILQVHDELIVECAREDAPKIRELLRCEMEGAVKLAVPLTVDIGVGYTWYDC